MDHGIRKITAPAAPVQLNFTSRFRGEHRSGACHEFGKGCSSGRSRIWERGQVTDLGSVEGRRAPGYAVWSRLVEDGEPALFRGCRCAWLSGAIGPCCADLAALGSAACGWCLALRERAQASPHVRLKTRLLVGAERPSDQTADRPALPRPP